MSATSQDLLAEAKCYICEGVTLGKALELALLARIATATTPAPAPVLSFVFPNLLWTFTGTNPATWSIHESIDGVTGWAEVDTAPGTSRQALFLDHAVWVRIVGVAPSVPASNVIPVS